MTPELSADDRLYVAALARAYVLAPEGNGIGEESYLESALLCAYERLVLDGGHIETDEQDDAFAAWRNDLIEDAECALAAEAPIEPAAADQVPA